MGAKGFLYRRRRYGNQRGLWLHEAQRCYWHAVRKTRGMHAPYEALSWWYLMRYVGMVEGTQL